MQFVALIIAILVMGIILSYIDRHSIRGKQLLIFFYLAIAGLSLLRGFMFGALLFGIFAFWHWTALQRLKEGWRTGAQPGWAGGGFSTTWGSNGAKPGGKRAKLPSGCPPNCAEEDLTGLNLRGLNLSGADLHGANLFVADLQQANLSRANLAGVDLGGANLVGADLRGTNLEGADLRGAKYDEQTMWPANFNPGRAGAIRKSD